MYLAHAARRLFSPARTADDCVQHRLQRCELVTVNAEGKDKKPFSVRGQQNDLPDFIGSRVLAIADRYDLFVKRPQTLHNLNAGRLNAVSVVGGYLRVPFQRRLLSRSREYQHEVA